MENKVQFLYGYIRINDVLIKISEICFISPNRNKHIGGMCVLLSSGKEILFERIPAEEFNCFDKDTPSFRDFIRLENFIVNVEKVIAITPIPEHYGYDGTFIHFTDVGQAELPQIDTKLVLEKIIRHIRY